MVVQYRARVDFSIPVESFLDPPAMCFRPDRKDLLSNFLIYGRMSRCHDLVRQKVSPIPFGEKASGQVDFRRRVISGLDLING